MARKVYVKVNAVFDETGRMTPRSIVFEDGQTYKVTQVTQVVRAAALKAGGTGIRYTCRIGRAESYLFFDDCCGKWFVEAKE